MKESFLRNRKGILLMMISSVCVCFGQLFWKISSLVDTNVAEGIPTKGLVFLGIGFLLYGIGALVMLVAYKFGSLSVLQPVLSLNYVLAIVLAAFILKEEITLLKVIGILCVLFGVAMIVGGDKK